MIKGLKKGTTVARQRHGRNPERTQQRIIAAALKEFCERGLAGARVDSIARRASINKRMLYHYFGNKNDLFREVLQRKMAERAAWLEDAPSDPLEIMPYWFNRARHDTDWVRLLEWEALQRSGGAIVNHTQRRRSYGVTVGRIRRAQKNGTISRDIDSRQIVLSMTALNLFPMAFPQLTEIIMGRKSTDVKFQKERVRHLGQLAAAIRSYGQGRPATPKSRSDSLKNGNE